MIILGFYYYPSATRHTLEITGKATSRLVTKIAKEIIEIKPLSDYRVVATQNSSINTTNRSIEQLGGK